MISHATAHRLVLDVVLSRAANGTTPPGYMVTTPPEFLLNAERVELAARYGHLVPDGTTAADALRVATLVAAHINGGGA